MPVFQGGHMAARAPRTYELCFANQLLSHHCSRLLPLIKPQSVLKTLHTGVFEKLLNAVCMLLLNCVPHTAFSGSEGILGKRTARPVQRSDTEATEKALELLLALGVACLFDPCGRKLAATKRPVVVHTLQNFGVSRNLRNTDRRARGWPSVV